MNAAPLHPLTEATLRGPPPEKANATRTSDPWPVILLKTPLRAVQWFVRGMHVVLKWWCPNLEETTPASATAAPSLPAPTPPAAALPVIHLGTTRSLAWCGEIIAANAEDVWHMTSEYVRTFAASGATLVFIDLGRLRFIDAAGAALMVRVKRWSRDLRVEIVFAHPQPHVRNVLHIAAVELLLTEGAQ